MSVTTSVEKTRPYRVLASCGHVVIRRMREVTAGIPYAPDVLLHAPHGMPCESCQGVKPVCSHYALLAGSVTRCHEPAVGLLCAPEGEPVPGGFYCWPHAAACVIEYQEKLGETWTVLPWAVRP